MICWLSVGWLSFAHSSSSFFTLCEWHFGPVWPRDHCIQITESVCLPLIINVLFDFELAKQLALIIIGGGEYTKLHDYLAKNSDQYHTNMCIVPVKTFPINTIMLLLIVE